MPCRSRGSAAGTPYLERAVLSERRALAVAVLWQRRAMAAPVSRECHAVGVEAPREHRAVRWEALMEYNAVGEAPKERCAMGEAALREHHAMRGSHVGAPCHRRRGTEGTLHLGQRRPRVCHATTRGLPPPFTIIPPPFTIILPTTCRPQSTGNFPQLSLPPPSSSSSSSFTPPIFMVSLHLDFWALVRGGAGIKVVSLSPPKIINVQKTESNICLINVGTI